MSEDRLWYRQPARVWTEALPLGNGRLGAMVWGGVQEEVYSLNEGTLWSGYPEPWFNDGVPGALAECRSLLKEGRRREAQEVVESRMAGRWTQAYLPLGRLRWRTSSLAPAVEYERDLTLSQALATVTGRSDQGTWKRQAFVSAPADVLVSRWTSSWPVDQEIFLESDLRGEVRAEPQGLSWSGVAPRFVVPSYLGSKDPVVWGTTPETTGMRATFRITVESDGQVEVFADRVVVRQARQVLVVLAAATSFVDRKTHPFLRGADEKARVVQPLGRAEGRTFESLQREHTDDHAQLYRRSQLRLGAPASAAPPELPTDLRLQRAGSDSDPGLVCLAFHYGRYLLISCSRPGGQPAPLQGLWNQDLCPPWSGNYTVNINAQMNYWPAETTGLAECHLPFLDFIGDVALNGQEVARRHYGARGWTAHHNLDIWAHPIPAGDNGGWFSGSACHLFWPLGGAWLSHHLWEHYAFGGDLEFLRTRAWPVLREAARFCLDWLCEAADGTLTTMPSTSPENRYLDRLGRPCSIDVGTTSDLVAIRELFHEVLHASRAMGIHEPLEKEVRHALSRLPGYRTTGTGALAEWSMDFDEEEPGHRHFSHLYGVYPGTQIDQTTPRWATAAGRSIARRLEHGGGGTGWSLAWLVCLQARLGDGPGAQASLSRWLSGSVFANLFDLHPTQPGEPGVFQIDGNFGVTAGIAELLVQSHGPSVRLLPALPPSWPSGTVAGLRIRGGGEISLEWNEGSLAKVELFAHRAATWTLNWEERQVQISLGSGDSWVWVPGESSAAP